MTVFIALLQLLLLLAWPGQNGRTALHLAARNANAELVKSLLAAGSNAMARDKVGKGMHATEVNLEMS